MFMSPAVFTFSLVSMIASLICVFFCVGSIIGVIISQKKKPVKKEFVNGSYRKVRK
jgi:hypothetical protein